MTEPTDSETSAPTSLIVCSSKALGNTRRIADEIADVLNARVRTPDAVTDDDIASADLIGWGSGIYWMSFASELVSRIKALDDQPRGRAFVFATSGMAETPLRRYTVKLSRLLAQRQFTVADEVFHCRGLDTMGPLSVLGGLNKGRPSGDDLTAAREFAQRMSEWN